MSHDVVVYSRVGCHLCDDAVELLRQHGLEPRKVDIDQDPELQQRYTTCVPVVVIDGKERFRGRIDPRLLKRLLRGSGAENASQAGISGAVRNVVQGAADTLRHVADRFRGSNAASNSPSAENAPRSGRGAT